ncbi:MAG: DUF3014 domain-containing protein [Pseudomonadales bacterium]|nr:DUF3014 domain-containing protein [Pseudomonadales bacterium]
MSENKPVLIALIVVGVLILGYVGYLLTSSEPAAPTASQEISIPAPAPVVEAEPEPEPEVVETAPPVVLPETPAETPPVIEEPKEPAFVLPLLDDSDQLIRDGVVSLTRNDGINSWLSPNELIRKFVVTVDNVANGSIPRQAVSVLDSRQPFTATQISEDVFLMDPASYHRYDMFADIFSSIDPRRAAEFYDLLKPLFKEAYGELGYPDKQFEDVIFDAVGRLLETPVIEGDIRLVRPVVMFEYQDPDLESLSAAQKQLIRMGPENTRKIQRKLSDLSRELRKVLAER